LTAERLIEFAWTICNLVGFFAASRMVYVALEKRRAVIELKMSTPHRIIAYRNLREEGAKIVIHVSGFIVGTWAIMRTHNPKDIDPTDIFLSWLLVLMMMLLALSSILNILDDRRMTRILDEQDRARGVGIIPSVPVTEQAEG
jgi:hypothetical protein